MADKPELGITRGGDRIADHQNSIAAEPTVAMKSKFLAVNS